MQDLDDYFQAAKEGNYKLFSSLLLRNPHYISKYEKLEKADRLAIHTAAMNGHNNIIGLILKENANLVNAVDSNVCTPLHLAAQKGHTKTVAFLLDNGADINANKTTYCDKGKTVPLHWTPLHCAVCDKSVQSEKIQSVIELLVKRGANPNVKDFYGRTPLLISSTNTNYGEVARKLVGLGANIDSIYTKDKSPWYKERTPLYRAAKSKNGFVVRALLDLGANFDKAIAIAAKKQEAANLGQVSDKDKTLINTKATIELLVTMRNDLNKKSSSYSDSATFPPAGPSQHTPSTADKPVLDENKPLSSSQSSSQRYPFFSTKSEAIIPSLLFQATVTPQDNKVEIRFTHLETAKKFQQQQQLMKIGFEGFSEPGHERKMEYPESENKNNNIEQDQFVFIVTEVEYNALQRDDEAYNKLVSGMAPVPCAFSPSGGV